MQSGIMKCIRMGYHFLKASLKMEKKKKIREVSTDGLYFFLKQEARSAERRRWWWDSFLKEGCLRKIWNNLFGLNKSKIQWLSTKNSGWDLATICKIIRSKFLHFPLKSFFWEILSAYVCHIKNNKIEFTSYSS